MAQNQNSAVMPSLNWVVCLISVVALAAIGVMTKRLDSYLQTIVEYGAALPVVSQRVFQIPQYAYVLYIACLSAALGLNLLYNPSPGGKLTVNCLLAIISTLTALLMWAGVSMPMMSMSIKRLSADG